MNDLSALKGIGRPLETSFDAPTTSPLRKLRGIYYRNRRLALTILCAGLTVGAGASVLNPPVYRAEAKIEVDFAAESPLAQASAEGRDRRRDEKSFLQTQVEIVKSQAIAQEVGQHLDLADETLSQGLSVVIPEATHIIKIGFEDEDPARAAAAANAFAIALLQRKLLRRTIATEDAAGFLSAELADAKQRLEMHNRNLVAFARANDFLDVAHRSADQQDRGSRSLRALELVRLNEAKADAAAQRILAAQKWTLTRRSPHIAMAELSKSPAAQQLLQERAGQAALLQQELQRRTTQHPAVKQLSARVDELDRQISTIAAAVRRGIGQDYEIALQNEQELQRSIQKLKAEALDEQDRALQYEVLRREADASRQLYDTLLKRHLDLRTGSAGSSAVLSILDQAKVPEEPVRPRVLLNMLLAAMTGFGAALFAIFIRESFQNRVRSPDDLVGLGLFPLAIVPFSIDKREAAHALAEPRSALTEAFQGVPTLLGIGSFEAAAKRIVVASGLHGEGRSVTALGIARAYARKGEKVLLVDADLRRPSLHTMVAAALGPGLGELLAGTCEKAALSNIWLNLDFLAAGQLQTNPAQLLAAMDLDRILLPLEALYDRIVIDTPPLAGSTDALRIASFADALVFVVEAGRSDRASVTSTLRRVSPVTLSAGAVLTKYDARLAGG